MNNPLIPQLRPDKNGKLVTRHVTDVSATSSLSSSLPAPSLATPAPTPEKTEKELAQEMRVALADRFYGDVKDEQELVYKNCLSGLSWLKLNMLENMIDALDDPPKYSTDLGRGNVMRHELSKGQVFPIIMQASVHDIGTALAEAGFQNLASPKNICSSHFADARHSWVSEEQIEDFRTAYLSTILELDEDVHTQGKMSYYRYLESMKNELDDVIKVLPIFHVIISDEDNYMLDDGIEKVLEISKHASKYSPDEIVRIATFIREREDRYSYEPELIDDMLANTESAVSTGWL